MANLVLKLRDNGYWYAAGTINGQRVRKASKFTKPDRKLAEVWILQYELELRAGKLKKSLEDEPFSSLIKLYEKANPNISYKEFQQLKIVKQYLSKTPVREVRTDLTQYIQDRHAKSQTNTIDRDINGRIRAIINFGRDRKLCGGFEVKVQRVDDTREVYLSKDLRERYLESWPEGELRDFATVLVMQGLRFGQAVNLLADDVQDGHIHTSTKKGVHKVIRQVYLPMHPRVRAVIKNRIKTLSASRRVFPSIEYQSYRRLHLKICESLDINDYRLHDNRTTFATHLTHDSHATPKEIGLMLSHKGTRNVGRYSQARELTKIINLLD